MIVMGLGILLPAKDYKIGEVTEANMEAKAANVADEMWRVLYGFPAGINLVILVSFFMFIRSDSIMYNLSIEKPEEAMKLIKKVYLPSNDYEALLKELNTQVYKKDHHKDYKPPFCEAVFSEKYIRGTLVALVVTTMGQ